MKFISIFSCILHLLVLHIKVAEQIDVKLSRQDDFQLKGQVGNLNKPAVKTIVTHEGDIYDCVDSYKQPAFDHPLLKNHSLDCLKKTSLHKISRENCYSVIGPKLGVKGDRGCPTGKVPIKRVTRKDLAREKLASKTRTLAQDKPDGTYSVLCRTLDSGQSGVGATLAVYSPLAVGGQQYSASRLRLKIGPDSIEVGLRADPTLYGDNLTRLYIRTDARQFHCFDVRCPGFVITNGDILNDPHLLNQVSGRSNKYEFPISIINMFISNDEKVGNWVVLLGPNNTPFGYWPNEIFEKPGLADYAEWGGEAFTPNGGILPPMGSGYILVGDASQDAYFRKVKVYDEIGNPVNPSNLEIIDANTYVYQIKDLGDVGGDDEYLIVYGGPGTTSPNVPIAGVI